MSWPILTEEHPPFRCRVYLYEVVYGGRWTPIYVGKGSLGRALHHLRRARTLDAPRGHNRVFCAALMQALRRGEHVVRIRLVGIFNEDDDAYEKERTLIQRFGRRSDGSGILLNVAKGGRTGVDRAIALKAAATRAPYWSEVAKKAALTRSPYWSEVAVRAAATRRANKEARARAGS